MKFKVSPKDMVIFSVFCIFLLYFSSIAVLNVFTLLNDGEFYGLNPIEGFTSKYIIGTLLVFFIVLATIFFSVSSSIFERGKGFGLSFGEKEEKGYSRWCKEKEMKKAYKIFEVGVKDVTASAGGVVFINNGKRMWVDDSENHTLVIGVTGSGKTTAVVDPLIYSLCKHGESMVITDPKGEIYKNHAELLKARGYKIVVLNFRDPTRGNAWNPLTLPYKLYKAGNIDKAVELVDDVALNILQDKKAQDPFWEKSASDYFSGCALGLLEDAKEEEVNLNSISYMTTIGEEKLPGNSTYIKEYFTLKGESSSPYVFASNTINSPTDTRGGILSVFRQKIRLFASREQLSEMLAYSDFNMRDIGQEKTAVFMIIHDEKTTYHALATIFIKQCYETLIDVAQANGGKLPYRTNFILDEFANMPPLKDVTTMVTAARSRAIRFTFIIQNFAQLNEVYGKEDAETIRSNCGNLMYLLTTELAALEEISKLCGEVKSKKDDKTASQPLVTVSDLQKLKMNEVIILRNRMNPFRTKLKQGFDTDWGDSEFGKAEFPTREIKEIKLFDVKEFVKKRKNIKDDGKSGAFNNPFGNPFGGGDAPKIPTFEEFMAARNAKKAEEEKAKEASATTATKPAELKTEDPVKPKLPTFDVDEMVKRIDAKLAELEAQEKQENSIGGNTPSINDNKEVFNPFAAPVQNPFEKKEEVISNPFENSNKSTTEKSEDVSVVNSVEEIHLDDETKDIKPMASEPVKSFDELMNENKQLTGIIDPTKVTKMDNNEVKDQKKEEPSITVDTSAKVIPDSDVSDDAFFDDFFEE